MGRVAHSGYAPDDDDHPQAEHAERARTASAGAKPSVNILEGGEVHDRAGLLHVEISPGASARLTGLPPMKFSAVQVPSSATGMRSF
jgi:hypothetical protein